MKNWLFFDDRLRQQYINKRDTALFNHAIMGKIYSLVEVH